MVWDLSGNNYVQTNLFVRLEIPGYATLFFSDFQTDFEITRNAVIEVYNGLGQLLTVGDTSSELRATPQGIAVSIAGIPTSNIGAILLHKVKGSSIVVYRGYFNPTTGQLISIADNPAQKFQGVVSNFDISDSLEMGSTEGTITLTLNCTSIVEMLNNKVTGRRTNPVDEKIFYPTDVAFDQVPALANSNFNFGVA